MSYEITSHGGGANAAVVGIIESDSSAEQVIELGFRPSYVRIVSKAGSETKIIEAFDGHPTGALTHSTTTTGTSHLMSWVDTDAVEMSDGDEDTAAGFVVTNGVLINGGETGFIAYR